MSDDRTIWENSSELSPVDDAVQTRILQLLPLHAIDTDETDDRHRREPIAEVPSMLLRVGRSDYRSVSAAIGQILRPGGVLVALSEQSAVVKAAGGAARENDIPFGADPVVFRCALDGFRTTRSFESLSYAPPKGYGHWRELPMNSWRHIGRASIEEQVHRQSGLLVGATVAVRSGEDSETLAVVEVLLDASIQARDAWGQTSLIAPLVLDLRGFETLKAQVALVNRLSAYRPDAFLLHLDGLHTGANPGRIAAALRLMLLLDQGAAPALLARASLLRRLVRAYQAGGFECGVGRLERFQLKDFVGDGGAGSQPPKVEVPTLVGLLPAELAQAALRSGVLPESPEIVEDVVAHNARVLAHESEEAETLSPAELRTRLRHDLVQASHFAAELLERGIDVRRHTGHLRTWLPAMDLADAWGLTEPGRVRASLEEVA